MPLNLALKPIKNPSHRSHCPPLQADSPWFSNHSHLSHNLLLCDLPLRGQAALFEPRRQLRWVEHNILHPSLTHGPAGHTQRCTDPAIPQERRSHTGCRQAATHGESGGNHRDGPRTVYLLPKLEQSHHGLQIPQSVNDLHQQNHTVLGISDYFLHLRTTCTRLTV